MIIQSLLTTAHMGSLTALTTQAMLMSEEMKPMHQRQQLVAIIGAVLITLVIFELVRRRKLREEYSWVWIATAIGLVVLALNQGLLLTLSGWIGAGSSVSTLFFSSIIFLVALAVQFSVRLSRLTHRQRTIAQRLALLEEELAEVRKQKSRSNRTDRKANTDEVA